MEGQGRCGKWPLRVSTTSVHQLGSSPHNTPIISWGRLILAHYSFLMSQKSSCFSAVWDLAPCPHSQCLFHYVLLMPTKFPCLAAAWDLAPCPHFHYLPNDLLHHQAGDRKGKVSNFRWLRDRKIVSGILSNSDQYSLGQYINTLKLYFKPKISNTSSIIQRFSFGFFSEGLDCLVWVEINSNWDVERLNMSHS